MISNITLGQYYPGKSFLYQLDPRAKIVATMIVIIAIFLANTLGAYAFLTGFILYCLALSRLPFRLICQSVKPLWIIIVFTLGIHMFTTPGEIIWQYNVFTITHQGLVQGGLMTARLVYLIVFSSLLTFTTSPIILTDGIERLLNPFRRFGMPAHELAMMMTIALRFIPTLLEETDRIMKAQTARGANFTSGNLWQRAKSMVPLLVPLFISAFRRADELATAMEARCYRGGENRTRMKELMYTWRDGVVIVTVIAVTAVLVFFRWFA